MRKKTLAVVLAVLAFSLIAASAASLGGINADDVGADTTVVASCDTDGVDVDFGTAFDGGAYVVDEVTVSGIAAACDGATLDITLSDGSGNSLYTGSAVVNDPNPVVFSGLTVDAEALEGVAIVITG